MSPARVAVVQFPGVNCEAETLRALSRAGLEGEVFRWTRPARELAGFDAFVLPGGFSYQDRVRAGALAAKDPLVDALSEQAERGRPVLGICNGAQVLVEAGLVPGGSGVSIALARNRMPDRTGYQARWSLCRVEESACVFTRLLPRGTILPMPVAHGEGRFTSGDPAVMERLAAGGQVPLRYVDPSGDVAASFPDNPNGSEVAAAAVGNARGNVLAMMPHPERVLDLGAVSRAVGGEWGARRDTALEQGGGAPFEPSPGMSFFVGLRAHMEDA
jgi:phosphoribosylformylglycinamidine synthase